MPVPITTNEGNTPAVGPKLPWWKRAYQELVLLNDTPERIAGGFAIGVFIGVAPTFGLGLILSAGLARLFSCNMAAGVVGSMAGAPPVIPLIWLASAWTGAKVLGLNWHVLYSHIQGKNLLVAGREIFVAYLVGNIFVTAVMTAAAYFIILAIMRSRAASRGPKA